MVLDVFGDDGLCADFADDFLVFDESEDAFVHFGAFDLGDGFPFAQFPFHVVVDSFQSSVFQRGFFTGLLLEDFGFYCQ